MAILKHVSIRNSDYGEAQRYLLFEHDPITQKAILDDDGNMIPRQGIIQSGINCDPFTFSSECMELNTAWGKNLSPNDVRAHHYILSFDPRDTEENGLTPEHAHELAEELANYFFAGHQVYLVTHTDGHNESGNIHTHIVLNSLRKENVPFRDFMERPTDCLAGYKHHLTPKLRNLIQVKANEICEREHLHTVDYSMPTDRRLTDLEYQAKVRGEAKLEEINKRVIAAGLKPRYTEYLTIKDEIRNAVDAAVVKAKDEEDFRRILEEQYHIVQKESRGVWSYIHQKREKPIRAKSLGRIYEKEAVLNRIKGIDDIDHSRPEYESLPKVFVLRSELRLVTDIQNCVKAQQSRAYARKVELSNLQQMARSVAYLQNHKIGSLEELKELKAKAETAYKTANDTYRENYHEIKIINEEIHYLGQYLAYKKTYAEFLKVPDRGSYRQAHQSQIDAYEQARVYLKDHYPEERFPSMGDLKARKSNLEKEQSQLKKQQQFAYNKMKELRIVDKNIMTLLAPHTAEKLFGTKQEML